MKRICCRRVGGSRPRGERGPFEGILYKTVSGPPQPSFEGSRAGGSVHLRGRYKRRKNQEKGSVLLGRKVDKTASDFWRGWGIFMIYGRRLGWEGFGRHFELVFALCSPFCGIGETSAEAIQILAVAHTSRKTGLLEGASVASRRESRGATRS